MKGLKILRKIFSKKRKERTEKELGRYLIRSSLSSSDNFGVHKSNVNSLPPLWCKLCYARICIKVTIDGEIEVLTSGCADSCRKRLRGFLERQTGAVPLVFGYGLGWEYISSRFLIVTETTWTFFLSERTSGHDTIKVWVENDLTFSFRLLVVSEAFWVFFFSGRISKTRHDDSFSWRKRQTLLLLLFLR